MKILCHGRPILLIILGVLSGVVVECKVLHRKIENGLGNEKSNTLIVNLPRFCQLKTFLTVLSNNSRICF